MSTSLVELPSAKQRRSDAIGPAAWYPYYAGYSSTFVRETLRRVGIEPPGVVLDPWNGAGTTTQAAYEIGHIAIGVDINPAVLYVAAARCCDPDIGHQQANRAEQFIERAAGCETIPDESDPLAAWIGHKATTVVRRLLRAFSGEHIRPHELCIRNNTGLTAERAFHFVAIFRALRRLVSGAQASNPTWLKDPTSTMLPPLAPEAILASYRGAVAEMIEAGFVEPCPRGGVQPTLIRGNATTLPLASNSVDAVITSPPYCTRIDYAVSTRLELAVLGLKDEQFRLLRDATTGTSTIRTRHADISQDWGPTCVKALQQIKSHSSKASVSYYLKTFVQYFADLHASFQEIGRCCRQSAPCMIVVQDSYYKDVHIDLPQIVVDMATSQGWKLEQRSNSEISRTMAHVNSRARKYTPLRSATEASLLFRLP